MLLDALLEFAPLPVVGVIAFICMLAAVALGARARAWRGKPSDDYDSDREGYLVSAVLGMLALLLGFTFALAVDRYEARRGLVLEEANAIGTAYLRAQLLPAPHRARISQILSDYTDNRIALTDATSRATKTALLGKNDRMLTALWAATAAAFDDVQHLEFSSAFLNSINALIDLDASRKAARSVRVPTEVLIVLFIYLIATSGVLGYVLKGDRNRGIALFVLSLLVLSLLLVIDIDRPARGGITEDQGPMLQLRQSLRGQPPAVFDRWRRASAAPAK